MSIDKLKQAQFEQVIKTRKAVFSAFKSGDDISISLIQRRCNLDYFNAARVLETLIKDELVEPIKGTFGKML